MKVLVYANKEKDKDQKWIKSLFNILDKKGVSYKEITLSNLNDSEQADAIFVLGGDGTILGLTEFSIKNNIPIIGINAGKLGFLTEFESYETATAVDMLIQGLLVEEKRSTMKITLNGVTCTALNDVVVQRVFSEEKNTVVGVDVSIDGSSVEKVLGDGVIVCTPTGSTAYSLSSGGAILAPGINAFSITPISAHSLQIRPIIYSADQSCSVSLILGEKAIVFYDGKFVGYLKQGDTLNIEKNSVEMRFLRKQDSNFYKILRNKMSSNTVGGKNG